MLRISLYLVLAKLAQSIFLSWSFHYSKQSCSHSYPCRDSEHNGIEIDAPRNNACNHQATASNYEEKDVLQFVASAQPFIAIVFFLVVSQFCPWKRSRGWVENVSPFVSHRCDIKWKKFLGNIFNKTPNGIPHYSTIWKSMKTSLFKRWLRMKDNSFSQSFIDSNFVILPKSWP